MMQKSARRSGLGKGLSALLEEMGSSAPVEVAPTMGSDAGPIVALPLGLIDPSASQPRRQFDDIALSELADSIRIKGVLQPILVRPRSEGRYEIVAGERRWRAAQMAGLHEIPVTVRELDEGDSFEAALIENVQRTDLNPLEEAEGYLRLVREFGHTQESIATLIGKSRSHIGNLLRILDLPENARNLVQMGLLTLGHAKAVLSAREPDVLAREIAERGLTVRQAEMAARKSHDSSRSGRNRSPEAMVDRNPDIEALELQLRDATGLEVTIAATGTSGSVSLRFSDLDQLDMIVSRLSGGHF